jgi:ketosteroid isomerase-like protein
LEEGKFAARTDAIRQRVADESSTLVSTARSRDSQGKPYWKRSKVSGKARPLCCPMDASSQKRQILAGAARLPRQLSIFFPADRRARRSVPRHHFTSAMTELPAPIAEFLRAYADCVLSKDAAGFAALYDDNVQVFDAWDTWRLQGRTAVYGMATAWFGSVGDRRVEVTFAGVHAHAGRDVAAVSALATYTAVTADGSIAMSRPNRMSIVLQRSSDGWRVVHEHTSVPVGFASGQAVAAEEAAMITGRADAR